MNLCITFRPILRTMETHNHVCNTIKHVNYTLSDKTVSKVVRNMTILYKVPCILVPYIEDLQLFLNETDITTAIQMVAIKYNLTILKPIQNNRRYKYSNALTVPLNKELKFFKYVYVLHGTPSVVEIGFLTSYIISNTDITPHTEDARYIKVINDDAVTFSTDYDDIKTQYFGKIFKQMPFFVVCNNLTQNFPQFGFVFKVHSKIIYIPFSYNKLELFYTTFPDKTAVFFSMMYTLDKIEHILTHLKLNIN